MSIIITRELLASYLDDALSEADIAQIEQELRSSESLRQQLKSIIQERDRGEHSVGAIWRRQYHIFRHQHRDVAWRQGGQWLESLTAAVTELDSPTQEERHIRAEFRGQRMQFAR